MQAFEIPCGLGPAPFYWLQRLVNGEAELETFAVRIFGSSTEPLCTIHHITQSSRGEATGLQTHFKQGAWPRIRWSALEAQPHSSLELEGETCILELQTVKRPLQIE